MLELSAPTRLSAPHSSSTKIVCAYSRSRAEASRWTSRLPTPPDISWLGGSASIARTAAATVPPAAPAAAAWALRATDSGIGVRAGSSGREYPVHSGGRVDSAAEVGSRAMASDWKPKNSASPGVPAAVSSVLVCAGHSRPRRIRRSRTSELASKAERGTTGSTRAAFAARRAVCSASALSASRATATPLRVEAEPARRASDAVSVRTRSRRVRTKSANQSAGAVDSHAVKV